MMMRELPDLTILNAKAAVKAVRLIVAPTREELVDLKLQELAHPGLFGRRKTVLDVIEEKLGELVGPETVEPLPPVPVVEDRIAPGTRIVVRVGEARYDAEYDCTRTVVEARLLKGTRRRVLVESCDWWFAE